MSAKLNCDSVQTLEKEVNSFNTKMKKLEGNAVETEAYNRRDTRTWSEMT